MHLCLWRCSFSIYCSSILAFLGSHQSREHPSGWWLAALCKQLATQNLYLDVPFLFSSSVWDASGKVADGVAAGATEARGHPELCEGVSTHFPGALSSHLERSRLQLALYNLTLATFPPEVLQQQDTTLRGQYCLVSIR